MERRKIYKHYHNGISNPLVSRQKMNLGGVFIKFPIFVSGRSRFIDHCLQNQVAVGTGYKHLYCEEDQATAHEISKQIVYLPFGNGFSEEEIEHVINTVNTFK